MKKLTALLLLVVLILSSCNGAGTVTEEPDTTLPVVASCDHEQLQTVSQKAKVLTDGFTRQICKECGEIVSETVFPATKTLKLLAIGNSFSSDATTFLWNILNDAGVEQLIVGNASISGCSLDTHWQNAQSGASEYSYTKYTSEGSVKTKSSLQKMLKDEAWDIVTLQQVSHLAGNSGTYGHFGDMIKFVLNTSANSNVEIRFHMTWAYANTSTKNSFINTHKGSQINMYNAIIDTLNTKVLVEEDIKGILPAGTAIQNLRSSYIGDTLNRDSHHLSLDKGRYTAALTWACTLTGVSPYDINWVPEQYAYIEDDFDAIREAVKNAVANPFEITKSTVLEPKKEFSDAEYFTNAGLNIADYELLDLKTTLHAYWDSASGAAPINLSPTDATPSYYIASRKFSKNDIPLNSVIIIDKGYKYRPEGWQVMNQKNSSPRPYERVTRFTLVNDDWWQDFNYRAFNLSSTEAEKVMAQADAEHLRIYIPKK